MTPPRLLLVDDNPLDALLLTEQLGDAYEVVHAPTLADGVRAIASRRPDCAVVDLTLPDARGAEVIEALCRVAPDVPLVAHSGLAADFAQEEAVRAGARAYVVKGASADELIDVLDSLLT